MIPGHASSGGSFVEEDPPPLVLTSGEAPLGEVLGGDSRRRDLENDRRFRRIHSMVCREALSVDTCQQLPK